MDASVLSDDSDYDIVSPETSFADLRHGTTGVIIEPPPLQSAQETFNVCQISAEDCMAFACRSLGISGPTSQTRTKRIYVDGIFDGLNVRDALQLRQIKLSFPSVWLVVGVFSQDTCDLFGTPAVMPEVERCEVLRHCRWVDEVLADAPCTLDTSFVLEHKIDYLAVEEGATVDPAYDKRRLKGYDEMKRNGIVMLTRRISGVVALPRPPRTPEMQVPDLTAHVDMYGVGY
ncbi:cholinephosphate cytidylyltransferase [Mycena pura]|uniref:choline-phosphate cytidylyltransferase n=1 Tax=Mycena pura TaxID=153505 RepID=A0AAD7E203_9AGAR|nr:cholinephosphate cytidylyltransferase [Mycena pura]